MEKMSFLVVPVRGCSMSPTFNPHCSTSLEGSTDDRVLVEKFCLQKYEFSLGDVIVFCSPNDYKEKCVKRITALPGDWVSSPFSNDVVKIPDGHCWVEGDNSASSLDSRSIGPVPLGLIKGRATHIIWPPQRVGKVEQRIPRGRPKRAYSVVHSFVVMAGLTVSTTSIMDRNQQYERVFNHIDENGDKKISAPELQKCVALIGGELTVQEAEAAVELVDSDEDGMLSLEEFVRLVEGGGHEEKMNELKEVFKLYEMEGRGCITPKSLKRMLSKIGESKSVDECKLMIQNYDLNGDGVLQFEEFIVMMS
ncbi:hypothetical protein ACET3Z_014318 [Daucus carota]